MKFTHAIMLSLVIAFTGKSHGASAALRDSSPAELSAGMEQRIEKYRRAHGVTGVAVVAVVGQNVLLARGFGTQADGRTPYSAHTACQLFSSTKALSSLVFASMVADRSFDLNKPLGQFLPDSPAPWRDIPFWRLLNHTSGITDIIDKPDFQRIDSNPALSNADVYEVLKRYPLDYQPGQYSRYRQSGYALAELIVTRELQITWAELVSERVLKPAGATHTFSASLAERSAPLLTAAGGYLTTAEDMGRIFTALNRGVIVSPAFLKDLMYSGQYNHSGYSLGNVLQTIGHVKTLGHEGGASRATIRYAPDNRVGVAVFTDQSDNRELTLAITDMLMRELVLGEKTREPIAIPLFSMLSGPSRDAVKLYRQEKSRRRPRYDFSATERTLHRLGYVYLKAKRPRDAVSVFKLNVEENPGSANAHDSLGEAYFETADYDRALVSYEKSLALDPGNYNAMAMIARIRAQAK